MRPDPQDGHVRHAQHEPALLQMESGEKSVDEGKGLELNGKRYTTHDDLAWVVKRRLVARILVAGIITRDIGSYHGNIGIMSSDDCIEPCDVGVVPDALCLLPLIDFVNTRGEAVKHTRVLS